MSRHTFVEIVHLTNTTVVFMRDIHNNIIIIINGATIYITLDAVFLVIRRISLISAYSLLSACYFAVLFTRY